MRGEVGKVMCSRGPLLAFGGALGHRGVPLEQGTSSLTGVTGSQEQRPSGAYFFVNRETCWCCRLVV